MILEYLLLNLQKKRYLDLQPLYMSNIQYKHKLTCLPIFYQEIHVRQSKIF